MNIWIYNSNSSGGNHEYAQNLARVYNASEDIQCVLVVPGTKDAKAGRELLLLPDRIDSKVVWLQRLYFLWRSLMNPIIMYRYLSRQPGKGLVLFNDYDQLTAPVWALLFRRLKRKYYLGVLLHDPDRTNYPPSPQFAAYTMRKILGIMDFILYHDFLPDLSYYRGFTGIKKSVPHGLYHMPAPDRILLDRINKWKGDGYLVGILGNIREEKNYALAIEALAVDQRLKLLIAGQPANTAVPLREFRKSAEDLAVSDRVFWHIGYLTEAELSAAVEAVDLPLLYYRKTFTSQSGILNILAARRKNVLISRTESAMSRLAEKYGFGTLVKADDPHALAQGIARAREKRDYDKSWEQYLAHADWSRHAWIMLDICNELQKDEALAG